MLYNLYLGFTHVNQMVNSGEFENYSFLIVRASTAHSLDLKKFTRKPIVEKISVFKSMLEALKQIHLKNVRDLNVKPVNSKLIIKFFKPIMLLLFFFF